MPSSEVLSDFLSGSTLSSPERDMAKHPILPCCLRAFSHLTLQFFVHGCAILGLVNFVPFLIQFRPHGMLSPRFSK